MYNQAAKRKDIARELDAMAAIARKMETLPPESWVNVLQWLTSYYQDRIDKGVRIACAFEGSHHE